MPAPVTTGSWTPDLSGFVGAAEDPYADWPGRFPGYRACGYLAPSVPEEILHAAGLAPIHLFAGQRALTRVEAYLQSFSCWPARSAFDRALRGDLDFVAGVAFGSSCDTLAALADMWAEARPAQWVLTVGHPVNLTTPAARPYLRAEYERLIQALTARTGRPLDSQALRASICLHNQTRRLVQRLYALSDRVPSHALYVIVRSAFLMPKEVYNERLQGLVTDLEAQSSDEDGNRCRLIMVGPVVEDGWLYQAIEEAGGRVVDDVLDLGHPYFDGLVAGDESARSLITSGPLAQEPRTDSSEDAGDPLEALVDRYLGLLPIPGRHHPERRRDRHLLDLVARRRVHGVIFALQKFCDPHGFDYVTLKKALDAAGVPHLQLELERPQVSGQVKTRVEAFIEMLQL